MLPHRPAPSARTLQRRLAHLAAMTLGRHIRPHDLRRSFVTRLRRAGLSIAEISDLIGHSKTTATLWLRNGGDLFTLQRILGHSSLEMVTRYAQQVVSDLQEKHRIYSPVDRMVRG